MKNQNKRPSEIFWSIIKKLFIVSALIIIVILSTKHDFYKAVLIMVILGYLIVCSADHKYYKLRGDYWVERDLYMHPKYNIVWIISKFLDRNYGK